jgi:hypothetical protein
MPAETFPDSHFNEENTGSKLNTSVWKNQKK